MVEEIPPEDSVSRWVDAPKKWSPAEKRYIDENLFIFSKPHFEESLVWRKYARTTGEVHARGCDLQRTKQAEGKDWTYVGAITANVGAIRDLELKGDRFYVKHAPEEGDWHAAIGFQLHASEENKRGRRADLKEKLVNFFKKLPFEQHTCA